MNAVGVSQLVITPEKQGRGPGTQTLGSGSGTSSRHLCLWLRLHNSAWGGEL